LVGGHFYGSKDGIEFDKVTPETKISGVDVYYNRRHKQNTNDDCRRQKKSLPVFEIGPRRFRFDQFIKHIFLLPVPTADNLDTVWRNLFPLYLTSYF
jgi:hypothetical protein